MKFIYTAEINQKPATVVELFMDKNKLKDWQTELINYELLSGTAGQNGAVTKQVHKSITIIETIVANQLPDEISGFYEHKAGRKTVMTHGTTHRFRPIGENKTLFELEMTDVKFIGLLPKLMSKLMGGMFERYHQNEVDMFKKLAEKQMN